MTKTAVLSPVNTASFLLLRTVVPRLVFAGLVLGSLGVAASTVSAAEKSSKSGNSATGNSARSELDRVAAKLTDHAYLLRYQFQPEEIVRYEVVHLVTVDTRVQGVRQENKSRSQSTKLWKISDVTKDGNISFSHTIERVNMWSETTGRKAIKFDSDNDEQPPVEYEKVAETIGKPISVITIDGLGTIVERKDEVTQFDMGTGGLTVPLPEEAIKVGAEWSVPHDVRVRLEDGRYQTIKTRQRYRLEKVATGVATISLKSQVLTPVTEGRVRSQLIQKLSQGEIKFDIDAGRLISKTLDWNELVVGFNGPESQMSYLARLTETLVPPEAETAKRVKTVR